MHFIFRVDKFLKRPFPPYLLCFLFSFVSGKIILLMANVAVYREEKEKLLCFLTILTFMASRYNDDF